MEEGDAAGVEGDAAVGVGAGGAILEVALDGAAEARELAADLVVAAGEQFYFEEPVAVGFPYLSIVELGQLRVFAESSGPAD